MNLSQSMQYEYLELLKRSLLNEIYLDNEIRFMYIFSMIRTLQVVDEDVVRNISARLPDWFKHVREAREEGKPWWYVYFPQPNGQTVKIDLRNVCEFSHTMVGRKRLENLHTVLDHVRVDNIMGDVAETGAWRGGSSIFMQGYFHIWDMNDRVVWVADSFEGLPKPTLAQDSGYDYSAERVPILSISLEEVEENFRRYGLLKDSVKFLKGWFRDTLYDAPIKQLSVLRLDGDLYESTMDALIPLYEKVSTGGFVIVDDYGDFEPCRRAVDDFRSANGITDQIIPIDWAGVFWRKTN